MMDFNFQLKYELHTACCELHDCTIMIVTLYVNNNFTFFPGVLFILI